MRWPKAGQEVLLAWQNSSLHRPLTSHAPHWQDLELALGAGASWQSLLMPQLALGANPGTPPEGRLTIPPNQDGDRIHRFNNPNRFTFPEVDRSIPYQFRNHIGYLTYVQFMMDHGSDKRTAHMIFTPLSLKNSECPEHSEPTAGGTFMFPPRSQPMHAVRRSLIAGIAVVKDRNAEVPSAGNRDWVSIVTYDRMDNNSPRLSLSLTADYDAAMQACTRLQAVNDIGYTTASESGMIMGKNHIAPKKDGGEGRSRTNKVVVLMTDGVPNLYESSAGEIDEHMTQYPDPDYYQTGEYWKDAALMQSAQIRAKKWMMHPVGIGLGTDYDFMDRMARLGGTADENGQSPRCGGNPEEYEQRLTEIFEDIINTPQCRLVD